MSELRIIPVVFGGKHFIITDHRMQYDYGQVLDFKDLELPDSFEARFSNSPVGESIGQIGTNNRIRIPKQFFESGEPIYCYITLHDEVTDGRTVYTTKVPIKPSSDRTDAEPEPEEESIITQAITALNSAVDTTAQKASEASASADRAEQAAEGVEGYAERAEAAQSASEDARDIALEAKVSAQASAATATEKASEAISSATTASQSALTAESASESAQASASASAESAEQASQSADTANGKASDASEYASNASASAQTASQKASEAAQSASTATQAKTDAITAKTASETAQGLAEQARDEAVTAKTDAESAKTNAQDIVDAITDKVEQIDSNTERIESLEDDRYKPYPTDTASGSIASFPDGADGIPLKSCIVQVEPMQDLHGYDHPWPAGSGKNLIPYPYNGDTESKNGVTVTVNNDGTIVLNGTATSTTYLWLIDRTDSIPSWVKPNTEYVVSGGNGSFNPNGRVQMILYGSPSWILAEGHRSTPADLSAYTSFAVVVQIVTDSTYNNTKIYPQIGLGSTVTAWTPYSNECPITGWTGCEVRHSGEDTSNPTTYPITFPTEAGTVYGAYVDVINGELVADRAMVDLGSLSWSVERPVGHERAYSRVIDGIKPYASIEVANAICSQYAVASNNMVYLHAHDGIFAVDDNGRIQVYDSRYISVSSDEFKVAMSGVQLVYELAEPIEIQLSENQINSLYGVNNLWANSGDSEVEYRADTKLYITKKITEAVSALS